MRKTASRRSTPARRLSKSKTLMDPTCSCFQKKIYVLIAIDMVFGSHHISYTSKHAKVREMRNPRGKYLAANTTQKEITSQTDQNLVIRFSKTYVSEDKPTKYLSIRPITSFSVRSNIYTSRSIQSKVNSVTRFKNGKSIEEFEKITCDYFRLFFSFFFFFFFF